VSSPDLILASASPRRRELLERLGLRVRVEPSDVDEQARDGETPRAYVERLAVDKGEAVAGRLGDAVGDFAVLGADTCVARAGEIFAKPATPGEAADVLRRLAGRRHEVITAYHIKRGAAVARRTVTTQVTFRLVEPAEVEAYVASGEWRGKAGGYAIQGIAAVFATEVRGSFTNVVGLPLAEALADLRAVGALAGYPPAAFGVQR
jgi:septum formation protein